MRRRILVAIIGVTVLATVVLTVPLAVVSSVRARSDSVRELERVAERVAADISLASLQGADPITLPTIESAVSAAVYLPDGSRVVGDGPIEADHLVRSTDLLTRHGTIGSALVVTRPVVIDERTRGVVRVSEPLSETEGRVRRDLLMLVAFDLAAIGIAAAAGWVLSRRLVEPLESIRDDAVRLGGGDFAIGRRVSGVAELDATSEALSDTAERLRTALSREREFSANVSHQLRTPLTALRLEIEGEMLDPRPDRGAVLHESLREVDRLESTITTLLAVARSTAGHGSDLDTADWTERTRLRWASQLSESGRSAVFVCDGSTAHVSRQVLDEIGNVLIDNALVHGVGDITVALSSGGGSLVLSVADSGALEREPARLFVRYDPGATGTGVGLALARSLAEGEGGRLVVAVVEPTEFRLVLPDRSGGPVIS